MPGTTASPAMVSDVWKWIAMALGGALAGSFMTAVLSMFPFAVLADDQRAHESMAGHPVMIERVEGLEEDVREIRRLVESLNEKFDRAIEGGE